MSKNVYNYQKKPNRMRVYLSGFFFSYRNSIFGFAFCEKIKFFFYGGLFPKFFKYKLFSIKTRFLIQKNIESTLRPLFILDFSQQKKKSKNMRQFIRYSECYSKEFIFHKILSQKRNVRVSFFFQISQTRGLLILGFSIVKNTLKRKRSLKNGSLIFIFLIFIYYKFINFRIN